MKEKVQVFAAGIAIALPFATSIHAEHDCIYVWIDGMPESEIARVIALDHGWYDGNNDDGESSADGDERYLGFFT